MRYILTFFLFLTLIFPNARAEKVYFDGQIGSFYQLLFKADTSINHEVVDIIEEAEIVIVLEPTFSEANQMIDDIKINRKKILFVFYYDTPKFFELLPNLSLKNKSEFRDKNDLNFLSNSPLNKTFPSKTTQMLIQYNIWKEVFHHLSLAKPVKELKERTR